METTVQALQDYLTSQQWDNVGVIAIGDELYVTIRSENYDYLPMAANALAGTLTAYGDYEITDRRAMQTGDGELVSVTYTVQSN